jgi:protein MpaA
MMYKHFIKRKNMAGGVIGLTILAFLCLVTGCGGPAAVKPAGPDLSPIWVRTAQTVTVGHSVRGWPIDMYVFGHGDDSILIFAAIHGDEWTAYTTARQLVELLEDRPDIYAGRTVAIIPVANPDGLERLTRTNINGVDVNRNFPAENWQYTPGTEGYGGTQPASEPEARAIITACEQIHPRRIISLHSIRNGKYGNNFDGPGEQLAEAMAAKNHYKVLPSIGYPTPGSFGTWAGIERHIPTITLELPREAGEAQAWDENRDALIAAVQFQNALHSQ